MYPSGEDLNAFLLASGAIEANTNFALDYDGYISAAIEQWENDTYWLPFLAEEQMRVYSVADGTLLDLGSGILSVSEFTLAGYAQVAGEDYDLTPTNAASKRKPFTAIVFRYPKYSAYHMANAISITGVFGYCATLPDDVRLAILSLGAVMVLGNVSSANGTITQIKQDDVSISYSGTNAATAHYSSRQLQYQSTYNAAVKRYKRTRLL